MKKIDRKYSLEKEQLIDRYIDKWDKIVFSTKPVDRTKAEASIINAYSCINLPPPAIYFLTSPSLEQCSIFDSIDYEDVIDILKLKDELIKKITVDRKIIRETITDGLRNISIFDEIENRGEKFENLCDILYEPYIYDANQKYNSLIYKILVSEIVSTHCWFYDLYFENSNSSDDRQTWNILKSLCEECPYLIPYKGVCIIIDKPIELHLDRELLAHAESKPAIKYADGFEIYCDRGFAIPAKYGQIPLIDWRAEWIIEEDKDPNSKYREKQMFSLLANIEYKKFAEEFPELKEQYWQMDGKIRQPFLLEWAFFYGIVEWLKFYYYRYYNAGRDIDYILGNNDTEDKPESLPFKLSQELEILVQCAGEIGNSPIAPRLSFIPPEQAISKSTLKDNSYAVPVLEGDRGEIYYINCDNTKRDISPVYCQLPNEEPIIYAECVTALFAAIAECYHSEAYYIVIDEETGKRSIEQDLDKVESSFEKFNPEQIDNWRKVWRR
jgi:hypothetical protein